MTDFPDKDDEFDSFRQAMTNVKPLNQPPRSDSRAPLLAPHPKHPEKGKDAAKSDLLDEVKDYSELEIGEELIFLRPGYQNRYIKRLRRSRYPVGDHLDLHSMNEETASTSLLAFIDNAVHRGIDCVRIVHGKGLRSKDGPILKAMTGRLLSRHPSVIAFASCRPVDGGTGAVAVLLKKRK